jgi:hypothetical protein
MGGVDFTERLASLIAVARERARLLNPVSPTRVAASDEWLESLDPGSDKLYGEGGSLPPLLLHLSRLSVEQLRAVDSDVILVKTLAPRSGEVGRFLSFGRSVARMDVRQWYAGRVELALQAHLVSRVGSDAVLIEPELPNGKRADMAIRIGERWVWIECTALSASDEDQDAFVADPTSARWGDPYLDARRIYRKAFDKIAGPITDMRSQLHPTEPNVLVLVDGAWQAPGFDSLGADWALEQMTDPSQRSEDSSASMASWATHDYGSRRDDALARLQDLSAIGTYGYDLTRSGLWLNKGCDESHRLSPDELRVTETVLQVDRHWL